MAQFVRAGLRINRWLETEGLPPENFPADVITDLRTQGNNLSVFAVSPETSAERIAIAVAAGKQDIQETAYAVFEEVTVVDLGIIPKKNDGNTFDATVNGCHYDLQVGTVRRLVNLAGVMATGDVVPILKNQVEALLKAGLESGQLDRNRMNPGLVGKLTAN